MRTWAPVLDTRLRTLHGGCLASLARAVTALSGADPPIHRATVRRWMDPRGNPWPQTETRLLAWAVALDLDPLALWDPSPAEFRAAAAHIERALRTGHTALIPAPAWWRSLLLPDRAAWPPPQPLRRLGARPWTSWGFLHDPRRARDVWRRVRLDPAESTTLPPSLKGRTAVSRATPDPQVWHFAWRDRFQGRVGPWRPYGVVMLRDDELTLRAWSGVCRCARILGPRGPAAVETWLGGGAAEFRIASLHPFQGSLTEGDQELPMVRFDYPSVEEE